MTRTHRVLVLASFLITLMVLLAVVTVAGGLGVIELAVCVVVAIPVSIAVNKALARRLGRRNATS